MLWISSELISLVRSLLVMGALGKVYPFFKVLGFSTVPSGEQEYLALDHQPSILL